MTNSNCTIKKASELLLGADKILIFTHQQPDGDTLGSAYALKSALYEKDVRIVCPTGISDRLSFICDGKASLPLPDDFTPDLICSVDVAELSMLDEIGDAYAGKINLKIDHHKTSELFAEYNLVCPERGSCAEIIYEICRKINRLNAKCAYYLYIGVSTDTGCFKYGNTTAKTHKIASELMKFDFDAKALHSRLFESKSRGDIEATRCALNSLCYYNNGKIALVIFTNEIKKSHSLNDDNLSLINSLPKEIDGVLLGITIKEKDGANGTYKVSMRSDGEIDVSELCSIFGGGGHKGAAGCTITAKDSFEAVNIVIDAVKDKVK